MGKYIRPADANVHAGYFNDGICRVGNGIFDRNDGTFIYQNIFLQTVKRRGGRYDAGLFK